jgi:hypothetical protein
MQRLVFGGSLGAGAMMMWFLLEALHAEPKLLLGLIGQWGATPVILMVALWFGNDRIGQGMALIQKSAEAQQKLADAVTALAGRDDRREQKQELMMAHISTQLEKVLERLEARESEKARVAGA